MQEINLGKRKENEMYLDNPKKLFDDLYAIPTMYTYMVACAEDGMDNDLSNLISIVKHNNNELHYGGEGSERWNLEYCETEEEKQRLIKDSRTLNKIYAQIKVEENAKYTLICRECGYVWYYSKKPKYDNGYKCKCGGDVDINRKEQ